MNKIAGTFLICISYFFQIYLADGKSKTVQPDYVAGHSTQDSRAASLSPNMSLPEPDRVAGSSQPGQLPKNIICLKDFYPMVLIPEGDFMFGADELERQRILAKLSSPDLSIYKTEFAKQTKSLPAYYIDIFEVTNEQYEIFINETGHRKPRYWQDRRFGKPKQPVIYVGWADAEAYARWAGKRLPNEEEWEKAARGPNGLIWPWGDEPSAEKYNGKNQGNWGPIQVGSYPMGKSYYGVMDMAGNVWEMTSSFWRDSIHVMRGGSYLNIGAETRTMVRWAMDNEEQGAGWLGFRCVMDTSQLAKYARIADEIRR